jgi:hypothetical protein
MWGRNWFNEVGIIILSSGQTCLKNIEETLIHIENFLEQTGPVFWLQILPHCITKKQARHDFNINLVRSSEFASEKLLYHKIWALELGFDF